MVLLQQLVNSACPILVGSLTFISHRFTQDPYTCAVQAVNGAGSSPYSAPSAPKTARVQPSSPPYVSCSSGVVSGYRSLSVTLARPSDTGNIPDAGQDGELLKRFVYTAVAIGGAQNVSGTVPDPKTNTQFTVTLTGQCANLPILSH